MNKKRNLVIVVALLLLLGTGTFVFANPSEDDISGTGNMGNGDARSTIDDDSNYSTDYNEEDDENTNLNDNSILENNENDELINNTESNIVNGRRVSSSAGVNLGNVITNNTQSNNGNSTNNSQNNNENTGNNVNIPNEPDINDNPEVDNIYDLALKAVEKAENSLDPKDILDAIDLVSKVEDQDKRFELEKRVNDVQKIVDLIILLENLSNMVNNATNKNDINEANNFRTKEQIKEKLNNLPNCNKKNELSNILNDLMKILDDNIAPVINGINDGEYTNTKVSLEIIDDNDVVIKLNGNIVSQEQIKDIILDGKYELVVIDKAFNETSISFTIDTKNPIITGVENNTYYNKEVVINTVDNEEVEVYLEKNGVKADNYKLGEAIKEDGTYKIYVTDKAGNVSDTISFIIDTRRPIITGVENNVYYNKEVVINTVNNEEVEAYLEKNGVKADNYKLGEAIKEDGTYKIYVTDKAGNVSETINFIIDTKNPTASVSYSTKDPTNGSVIAKLENFSEEVKILNNNGSNEYIFNTNGEFSFEIEDLAGNRTLIIAKVDNIDKEAPLYNHLGILNWSNYKMGKDINVAKTLDEVMVFVTFNERLKVNPKVIVNGIELESYLDEENSKNGLFVYLVKYVVRDTDKEEIQFVVKDYADEASNVGSELNNSNINHETYKQVKVVLESNFEFINGASFNTNEIVIKNPNYAYMTVYNWQSKKTDRVESNIYKVSDNTMYTFTLYDKNNNILEQAKMIYDDINPKIVGSGKNGNGITSVINDLVYDNVDLMITDNDLHIIKRVFEDGHEEVIKEFGKYDSDKNKYVLNLKDNGNYNIVAVDRAGNEASIRFTVKARPFVSGILSVLDLN